MSTEQKISILTANIARLEAQAADAISRRAFDEARRIDWFLDDVRDELRAVRAAA